MTESRLAFEKRIHSLSVDLEEAIYSSTREEAINFLRSASEKSKLLSISNEEGSLFILEGNLMLISESFCMFKVSSNASHGQLVALAVTVFAWEIDSSRIMLTS